MNKKLLYGLFGFIGGLLLSTLLIFMYVIVYINELRDAFSYDLILFSALSFITLSIAGFLSGVRYFQKKSTGNIWLFAYIIIYVYPVLGEILKHGFGKELLIVGLFYIFAFLYAELSDYIWKMWMKYVSLIFYKILMQNSH